VNFARVKMYWRLGERIFIEEQQGKERADYGAFLICFKYGSAYVLKTLSPYQKEAILNLYKK